MSNVGLYAKAIVGALSTGAASAITALGDGHITVIEWLTIAGATVLALGAVWAVPNTPKNVQKYGKAIAAAVAAGLGAVATAYVSGGTLNPSDVVNVAVAILAGLAATFVTPNAAQSDPVLVTASTEDLVVRASEVEDDDDIVEDDEVPADLQEDSDAPVEELGDEEVAEEEEKV